MNTSRVLLFGALAVVLFAVGLEYMRSTQTDGGTAPTQILPPPETDLTPPREGDTGTRTMVVAGGCFWCTEAVFEQFRGVKNVVSGYAGGSAADANYHAVSAGRTDHAEAIEITYDPHVITYGELLHVFFDSAHNPTHKDRQGPDTGRQYRSAIFHADEDQKRVAEAYIAQLDATGLFDAPIATTLEPLRNFYPAEEYHQDYIKRWPNDSYVRRFGLPKVEKARRHFPDKVHAE